MKKTRIGILFLLVMTIAISCSKTGPMGPAGKDGANGANGVNGINGTDGSTIYSGQSAPTTGVGKNGDFYIDLSNGMLYGPKTSSGWGTGFSLKGKDGTNGTNGTNGTDGKDGTNGTQILSGSGYPSADIGNIGDFYLDTSNYTLYGPKVSATDWGSTGLVLKGQDGTNGTNGTDGTDANVRSYVISNPWNYYYTDIPTSGLFRFFVGGNFEISSYEADYGMVLVYLDVQWSTDNSSWLLAGTTVGSFSNPFQSSAEVVENDDVVSGVFLSTSKYINPSTTSGSVGGSGGWADETEAQSITKISQVKIIVIPPVSLTIMAAKGVNTKSINSVAKFLNL